MKQVFVFPGQGAQFMGMGAELYKEHSAVRELLENANDILGFRITDAMFEGSEEELKQTNITQPAIFLQSLARLTASDEKIEPALVAGHSLGEFTALVANKTLAFEDALLLVSKRAQAMQDACEKAEGTMAAILGLDDNVVEVVCQIIQEIVVPANYNCPGQLVISGSMVGVDLAIEQLKGKGARRALKLPVRGAFHSPLMEPAKKELETAVRNTTFHKPTCPVVQNVNALIVSDPEEIKNNIIQQLTSPVRWTQSMYTIKEFGPDEIIEVGGNKKVLSGFFKRFDRALTTRFL